MAKRPFDARHLAALGAIGAVAGLMSGLFGVGGGLVIVPGLVWYGMMQREAAATSMAAIVPISLAALASYAFDGNVDWVAGLLMAAGFAIGAQIGSALLGRISESVLRWFFVAFVSALIISQLISIPTRDATISMAPALAAGIVACGLGVGILSPLLGVGGGAIMVPALAGLFGASDLIARGTSLLAMFPGSIAGTIPNARRGFVNTRMGLSIGVVACAFTPLGAWIAAQLSPRANTYLFAAYLAVILARSLWAALHSPPRSA